MIKITSTGLFDCLLGNIIYAVFFIFFKQFFKFILYDFFFFLTQEISQTTSNEIEK